MSLEDTIDNLAGLDAITAVDQLASIWDPAAGQTVNASQLEAGLATADAARNQQTETLNTDIAAEQKQIETNDQSIAAAAGPGAAIDLDTAKLEGTEAQLESEAAALQKEQGPTA